MQLVAAANTLMTVLASTVMVTWAGIGWEKQAKALPFSKCVMNLAHLLSPSTSTPLSAPNGCHTGPLVSLPGASHALSVSLLKHLCYHVASALLVFPPALEGGLQATRFGVPSVQCPHTWFWSTHRYWPGCHCNLSPWAVSAGLDTAREASESRWEEELPKGPLLSFSSRI